MKAQHSFGLNLSWLRVTTVFLIDIAILRIAGHWPDQLGTAARAWWPGVGVAAVVTMAALITHRRVPLTAILLARLLDRFANPASFLNEGCTPGFDHRRRYSRDVVGLREYQGQLVTVIAVEPSLPESSGRHRRGHRPPTAIPVGVVAAALRQFDVRLDGIDIVSVLTRDVAADGDGSPGDDERAPAVPADSGPRDTWLILRMDPMRNAEAVAVRDSVAATLAVATERLAHALQERHVVARVLAAEEFADVDAAILAGLSPSRIRRRRRRLKQKQPKGPKQFAATFWMSPRDISTENLERLWLPAADTTAVTVRLSAPNNHTEVSVLVRYHSADRLRRKMSAGLNRLNGRQLTALRTSLPTAMRRALAVPGRQMDEQESLQVPLGPTAPQPLARVRVPA
ncbi:ESX-5 secretion system protein EccE5 [Mycolicibacter terrae]|uniref:ESX-5 secretion system protein EccE5 n=1 Tax=Mycolicibacter terrae TaxID=1788 RepID=A0AAD1MEG8_9MYCO|nr:type VII secretion protein EccE [Mycolicibacter terrae]ORW90923.1 type VII secretion protein EccE [Mycolicibacter terrae]BBX21327.1 ESX-5 secretion system protein EccE5 [Mycolicibacter terrae]SNV90115.1 ESX-5 type VII secretion system protein,probable membrane protein [Mycolicibacter terrae]